jgi:hypothetical protein
LDEFEICLDLDHRKISVLAQTDLLSKIKNQLVDLGNFLVRVEPLKR